MLQPFGAPWKEDTRLLVLPPEIVNQLSLRGGDTMLALHRLLHNLATIGALLGLTPLIPNVPCSLFQREFRVLSFVLARSGHRFGINLPDVLAAPGQSGGLTCTLFPGGAGCTHEVMHAFDYGDFSAERRRF